MCLLQVSLVSSIIKVRLATLNGPRKPICAAEFFYLPPCNLIKREGIIGEKMATGWWLGEEGPGDPLGLFVLRARGQDELSVDGN